ncbi:hypothetical protein HH308_02315 [Gordonia sp. TBRC 11910]|uniref:Uncharacterized protein n=1 Tax=Gordonia asplenii TaxID=2725283 RepID=A0A848KLS8_9ACTN|nr:hypothetical protein [Gordonia asplenii]NMO00044.1 hypothetical protein [Gordonia asplenii]
MNDSSSKSPHQNRLRSLYNQVETAVAPKADAIVASADFLTTVNTVIRLRRTIGSVIANAEAGLLHLANIPSATDIRRLHRQIGALDYEIRLLRLATTHPDPGPTETENSK